ncbi:segregation/condensation protein A [Amnibacterium sp. CER49]|uniref:segregation and condensation protein A n=1 Tax=Amnibacterium sp. CER49 TaxID=3039161 RepID=UPI00244AB4B8|nr:segregation/condensation protein A [Amnibacterium sp. CER49]MDH2444939.1 segregation/condensation protein A [Amnibacterium sp. CER49]
MRSGGDQEVPAAFRVRVGGFDGPFDLLLDLLGRHELEVTELSLSQVTDEFLAHLGTLTDGDLDEASSFLVVGATLLDLKIAGLLPAGEVVDAEGAALLEARDLLFARLLQYRAYREATTWFADALAVEAARHPRPGGLDERFRPPPPPADLPVDVAAFAALAAAALAERPVPQVALTHLHAAPVSLRAQAAEVVAALRRAGSVSFPELVAGEETPVVVARFLVVLELHRLAALSFEQLEPLGPLLLRWSAPDWDDTVLMRLGGADDD